MSEPAQKRDEEISAYLLGELEEAERADFERRLARDPELRDEVEGLRPVVSRLVALPDQAWDAPEPPPLGAAATAPGREPQRDRPRAPGAGLGPRLGLRLRAPLRRCCSAPASGSERSSKTILPGPEPPASARSP